jgi:hypothetical protein
VFRWVVAAVVLGFAVGVILRFAPDQPQPIGWISFGTSVMVGAWILTSILFGLYIRYVASYGSIFRKPRDRGDRDRLHLSLRDGVLRGRADRRDRAPARRRQPEGHLAPAPVARGQPFGYGSWALSPPETVSHCPLPQFGHGGRWSVDPTSIVLPHWVHL